MQAYMGLLPAIIATGLNLLNLEYPERPPGGQIAAVCALSLHSPAHPPQPSSSTPKLDKKDAVCLGAVAGEDRGLEVVPQAI